MSQYAKQGAVSPKVRLTALSLTSALKQKDFAGEMKALFTWVQTKIRYVRDIRDVETVHTADAVLELRAGDCDDKAVLLGALLLSIGFPVAFVALDQGRGFVHVWLRAWNPYTKRWIDLDPTEPLPMGKTVPVRPGKDKLLVWPV